MARRSTCIRMEIISIIPLFACLVAVFTRGTRFALQSVVLPAMLLLPTYYFWTARPLPSINFLDAAFLGLGIGMAWLDLPRWRFARSDAWMAIFLLSVGYADRAGGRITDSYFIWFNALVTALVPYMAGKLLMEHKNSRVETSRRIVWLMVAAAVVSTWEYVFKNNPFARMWNHFYPSQWSGWVTQIRWGFGRVAGPFAQSELAGIVFSFGFLLALWLAKTKYEERYGRVVIPTRLERAKWAIGGLLVILFMTQARGPWIGTILALCVASIGRAKNARRRAILVVGLLVGIGTPTYIVSKAYISGPRVDYGSERETAQYRAELLDNYIPVAQQGGAWGWGGVFPRIHGQTSIDNQYLFVWVTQGYVGGISFCLLLLEAGIALIGQAVRVKTTQDRHFVLTLFGILVGFAFIIATVFLGAQSYPLFFFLIGWAQAVGAFRFPAKRLGQGETAKTVVPPAMIRIYT